MCYLPLPEYVESTDRILQVRQIGHFLYLYVKIYNIVSKYDTRVKIIEPLAG